MEIHAAGGKRNLKRIYEARNDLELLISFLTSKLMAEADKKSLRVIYLHFKSDLGRMLKMLDEAQENYIDKSLVVTQLSLMSYARVIRLYLDMLIIQPLKQAIELAPDDKRRFLYELFRIWRNNAGIFGAEARVEKKGRELFSTSGQMPTYEEFNESETQKQLDKAYDERSEREMKGLLNIRLLKDEIEKGGGR